MERKTNLTVTIQGYCTDDEGVTYVIDERYDTCDGIYMALNKPEDAGGSMIQLTMGSIANRTWLCILHGIEGVVGKTDYEKLMAYKAMYGDEIFSDTDILAERKRCDMM